MRRPRAFPSVGLAVALVVLAHAQTKPRARDLGIPFDGLPGSLNAITDVTGVEVGLTTLISGKGPLVVGRGPVRTGVTAVFPRGKEALNQVFAAWFTLNGNGEMTGTTWLDESGFLEGPVLITNTHSVGVVHDAVIAWQMERLGEKFPAWSLPSWPRPGTGTSTISTGSTSSRNMSFRLSTTPGPARSPKGMSAAARV